MHDDTFIKLTNAKCTHRGFKFTEGMNIDSKPFDESDICGGGLHFCAYKNMGDWVFLKAEPMMSMWDVTIPEGEKVVCMGNKLKSHRIILSNKRFIWDNHDICLHIVKRNGLALEMVLNQTDDMCLAAVKNYGCALQFVNNKTQEICIEAVSKNKSAIEFVYADKEIILNKVAHKKLLNDVIYTSTNLFCIIPYTIAILYILYIFYF